MADNYIKQIELVQSNGNKTINIGTPHLISTTWKDLKNLMNDSKLIEGVWYRITDYKPTSRHDGSLIAVPNQQFDILALAVSNNELSKECRAMHHDGDTYFSRCDVLSWKVWCDFNSDSEGYITITRLIDEYKNDCPYDFKNMKWAKDEKNSDSYYTFEKLPSKTDASIGGYATNNVLYSSCERIHIISGETASSNSTDANVFNERCHDILLNDGCKDNVFGINCGNISLPNGSIHNRFGTIGNGISDVDMTNMMSALRTNQFVFVSEYPANNIEVVCLW